LTEYVQTALANTAGVAIVRYEHGKGGIWQIIWQTTVRTIPVRTSARATITRNGQYITSTIVGSGSSAQGPPALKLDASDVFEVTWIGLTNKDQAIALLLMEEVPAGTMGSGFGLV